MTASRSALLGAIAAFFFGCTACTACDGCTPPPGPIDASPPPIGPTEPTAQVYATLVEAGCLAPDDSGDGVMSIYETHASDMSPLWLECLFAGNPVASCNVPCDKGVGHGQ